MSNELMPSGQKLADVQSFLLEAAALKQDPALNSPEGQALLAIIGRPPRDLREVLIHDILKKADSFGRDSREKYHNDTVCEVAILGIDFMKLLWETIKRARLPASYEERVETARSLLGPLIGRCKATLGPREPCVDFGDFLDIFRSTSEGFTVEVLFAQYLSCFSGRFYTKLSLNGADKASLIYRALQTRKLPPGEAVDVQSLNSTLTVVYEIAAALLPTEKADTVLEHNDPATLAVKAVHERLKADALHLQEEDDGLACPISPEHGELIGMLERLMLQMEMNGMLDIPTAELLCNSLKLNGERDRLGAIPAWRFLKKKKARQVIRATKIPDEVRQLYGAIKYALAFDRLGSLLEKTGATPAQQKQGRIYREFAKITMERASEFAVLVEARIQFAGVGIAGLAETLVDLERMSSVPLAEDFFKQLEENQAIAATVRKELEGH